jgi:hypothetical protein
MSPTRFLELFLRDAAMDGSEFKPPRIVSATRDGDVMHFVLLTELTSLDGKQVQRTDKLDLKAMNDTWKLMLSPELIAYAQVLISE